MMLLALLADLNVSNDTLLTVVLCLVIIVALLWIFGRGWRR